MLEVWMLMTLTNRRFDNNFIARLGSAKSTRFGHPEVLQWLGTGGSDQYGRAA